MKRIIAVVLLPLLLSFIQNVKYELKGTVTDAKGKAVTTAEVRIKGTRYRTNTAAAGGYTLKNVAGTDTLVVSAAGFQSQQIAVQNRKKIDVVLKTASDAKLDEVVVTAMSVNRQKRQVGYAAESYAPLVGVAAPPPSGSDNEGNYNREGYSYAPENEFLKVTDDPLSTFSIDVDNASYSNIRRFLKAGNLPPAGAVRIEEMINYFKYDYPQPTKEHPFSVTTELGNCPWNNTHKLMMVGLQGKKIPYENLPASNLVFLIDVSGSMMSYNKLPLVKASLKLLTEQLREQDKVAIVTYAGNAGLVLNSTSGASKNAIIEAIDRLEAGGSTAGGAGIQLAYKTAAENLIAKGNNRVILCTDGDFNVGASSDDALVRMIDEKKKSGVFLTVLGYGMGNYQDAKMQQLADKGNGNHYYIDEMKEARKVLMNEFAGTLFTIAKDVKLQVEFNPAFVKGYRLIGYENRILAKKDFNDDTKDPGEMGSGHSVTALYEIIPADADAPELNKVDDLKYQKQKSKTGSSNEWANVKMRYKTPEAETSIKFEMPVKLATSGKLSGNLQLATSVAEFGMLLTGSKHKGMASYERLVERMESLKKDDLQSELQELIKFAQTISMKAAK